MFIIANINLFISYVIEKFMRTKAERRDLNIKKALRKKAISDEWFNHPWCENKHYYDNLHQYSKNKIHCSCHRCAIKTNNKGRNFYYPTKNWKISDMRKIIRLEEQIGE